MRFSVRTSRRWPRYLLIDWVSLFSDAEPLGFAEEASDWQEPVETLMGHDNIVRFLSYLRPSLPVHVTRGPAG